MKLNKTIRLFLLLVRGWRLVKNGPEELLPA